MTRLIKEYNISSELLTPLPEVQLVKESEPEAGFFAVFDFTGLLGYEWEGKAIKCENDVQKFLYINAGVWMLMGSGFFWPDSRIVARITFSMREGELVDLLCRI